MCVQRDWNCLLHCTLPSRSHFSWLVYDFVMDEDGLCAHWWLTVIHRHSASLVVFLCPLLGRLSSSVPGGIQGINQHWTLLKIMVLDRAPRGVPAYWHTGQGLEQLCMFLYQLKCQGKGEVLKPSIQPRSLWLRGKASLVLMTLCTFPLPLRPSPGREWGEAFSPCADFKWITLSYCHVLFFFHWLPLQVVVLVHKDHIGNTLWYLFFHFTSI